MRTDNTAIPFFKINDLRVTFSGWKIIGILDQGKQMLLFFFYPYRDLKPEHHQVCDQNDSSFTVIIRASVHTVSPEKRAVAPRR